MELELHRKRLVLHEIGHYVAARALGFATGDVNISVRDLVSNAEMNGGSIIRLSKEEIGTLNKVRDYLERRITVLYAGACAETLKPDSSNLKVDSEEAHKCPGAAHDFAKALELINLLRNIHYPATNCRDVSVIEAECKELDSRLWEKAIRVVERNAGTIVSLAKEFKGMVCFKPASVLEAMPEVRSMVFIEDFDDL